MAVAFLLSLAHGANPIPYADVWDAIWNRGENEASWIVWDQRLPRTVIGILTGAAFALAGALIQALSRNPLADSGILGVNAGAGLAVTVGVGLFGVMRDGQIVTTGDPADVMTPQLVEEVFGLKALVVPDPVTGTPTIVPLDPRSAEGSLGPVSPITEEA